MIHPYWGTLVTCGQCDWRDHEHQGELYVDECWACGDELMACRTCKRNAMCCYCGEAHAAECPWPL